MPVFSKESLTKLDTLDKRLQIVLIESIKIVDFKIIEGHRPVARQQELYAQGRTKPGPIVTNIDGVRIKGKHNYNPSKAVDCEPWPIDYKDIKRYFFLAGVIKAVARSKGFFIRWGGDWDNDNVFNDQTFNDLPHFEIIDI